MCDDHARAAAAAGSRVHTRERLWPRRWTAAGAVVPRLFTALFFLFFFSLVPRLGVWRPLRRVDRAAYQRTTICSQGSPHVSGWRRLIHTKTADVTRTPSFARRRAPPSLCRRRRCARSPTPPATTRAALPPRVASHRRAPCSPRTPRLSAGAPQRSAAPSCANSPPAQRPPPHR